MNRGMTKCLAGVAALLFASAANASPIEIEFDLSVLTTEPIMIQYGGHTSNGALDATTDIDGFKFSGNAGDNIRIVLAGRSNRLDPRIELRNSVGAVIDAVSCNAPTTLCSTALEATLLETGEHFINVSDSGTDDAGAYTLHLAQLPPHWSGQGIILDETVNESLGHIGDHDFYHFEALENNQFRISLDGLSNRLDPRVQVWDPSGALLEDQGCNAPTITCSVVQDVTAAENGIYTLAIFDSGFNDAGSYNLSVNCLFGSCPLGPPTHVPVPAALPLFLTGLIGMGAREYYGRIKSNNTGA